MNNDSRSNVRGWLVAAALCGLSLSAGAVSKGGFGKASTSSNGNSTSIGPMTNASGSTIPISPNIGGWTQAGNYGVPPGASGTTMNLGTSGNVFFSGQRYPFQAGYSKQWKDLVPTALGAVGTMGCSLITSGIGTAVCAATVPVAMPFVYQWLTSSGARMNPDTGNMESKPQNCSGSSCTQYRIVVNGTPASGWADSRDTACSAWFGAQTQASLVGNTTTYEARNPRNRVTGSVNECVFDIHYKSSGALFGTNATTNRQYGTQSVVWNGAWYPASMSDIIGYMEQHPPDPRAFGEIVERGVDVDLGTPAVTGPSSIQGPETTKQNQDGSKEVSRTTYNFNTAGNTITNTSNVTTTNYYNSSNVQTGTSSSTTTPTPDQATPQEQEKEQQTQCDKYPDTLGCADLDTPTAEIPREERNITYSAETPFGGGSCPADKYMTVSMTGQSVKAWDWAQTCSLTATYVRPLIILLATISAFFIVALGRDEQ